MLVHTLLAATPCRREGSSVLGVSTPSLISPCCAENLKVSDEIGVSRWGAMAKSAVAI